MYNMHAHFYNSYFVSTGNPASFVIVEAKNNFEPIVEGLHFSNLVHGFLGGREFDFG